MFYNNIKYNDIVNNEYSLLAMSYSFLNEYKQIDFLKSKYENIFDCLNSIDGFTFSSRDYLPNDIHIKNKIPLVQIGNVNKEFCISNKQKFEFLSAKIAQLKNKYLLKNKCILVSLTGGSDYTTDTSTFFDNDFPCLLNQRVTAFQVKKEFDIDLLYYFYAFTKHKIFNIQWIGTGSIQKNTVSKERNKVYLPKIKDQKIIKYISIFTQAIINKEKLIKERHQNILESIEKELKENQKRNSFKFEMPRIKEIEKSTRLDTGIYSHQFKKIDFLVRNYTNGVFHIDENKIKSGNTPDVRYIGEMNKLNFRWVTPTHCSDFGFIYIDEGINLKGNNNINEECLLLVNRTSKGGFGEYVGIANYYDYKLYNAGHHNQGLYKVFDYTTNNMLFMLCFINCDLMRKYCGSLSAGSKMKELKIEQFLQIPFPNFPETKQKEIVKLYHNDTLVYDTNKCTLDNFLQIDAKYNEKAGIYELDKTTKKLKEKLDKAIDDIVNDKQVNISFDIEN